jgi:hypothetical protein
MPTIKLKNGSVILKDGKVSCTCCEGCCMYEAGLLGDTYTVDDLPDAILIDGENAGKVSSIPNRGSIEVGYWKGGTPADGDYCVAHTGGTSWRFEQYNADSEEWNEIGESSDCLFGGLFKPSGYLVEDQFADTYTLKAFGPVGGFVFGDCEFFSLPADVVLARVSLCVWQAPGVDVDVFGGSPPCDVGYSVETTATLSFSGTEWGVGIGGYSSPKTSGNQNTPVGEYFDMEIVE